MHERLPQAYHRTVRSRVCVDRKMPVDFASYLLSASPPGFEVHCALRDNFGLNERPANGRPNNGHLLPLRSIMVTELAEDAEVTTITATLSSTRVSLDKSKSYSDSNIDSVGVDKRRNNKFVCETKSAPSRLQKSEAVDCKNVNVSLNNKLNNLNSKKKVSFADEVGLAIAAVRIITERPDTPPQLRPEILSSLTKGASAGVTETPPLALNFEQPASDYVAFREKIDKNFVSLENVILRDYNVLGTIKVKNVAFNKSVVVRCTFDSWESSVDISANYVPTNGVHTGSGSFDTFSFEMSVPPNFNMQKKIQFAVCYSVESQTYWDNNNGDNYEVVSADWKAAQEDEKSQSLQEPVVFDHSHFDDCWTEFSSWSNIDNSVPYY